MTSSTSSCTILLIFIVYLNQGSSQLQCYDCQGGLGTDCARVEIRGSLIPCSGKNAQCYESVIDYGDGALQLVERRCWTQPNNTDIGDYCEWFKSINAKELLQNNNIAKVEHCKTCTNNSCNTNVNFLVNVKQ